MPDLPKVLIAEDDDCIRLLLQTALRDEPLEVHAAEDGLNALRMAESAEYAIILLDLMMPVINGFDFLEAYYEARPQSRSVILVLTAFDDRLIGTLPASRVHAIVRKPFDIDLLVATVRECAHAWAAASAIESVAPAPFAPSPTTHDPG